MIEGAKTVFIKEIREMARDKRVRQATIVMPVFMIAMFVFLFGFIDKQIREPTSMPIAVMGMTVDQFNEQLTPEQKKDLIIANSEDQGKQLLKDKKVRLFLEFPTDYAQLVKDSGATVKAFYNSDDPLSMAALGGVQRDISRQNTEFASQVLENNKLNPKLAEAVKVDVVNTAKNKTPGGGSIVGLLPYLIVIWAFYGGMSIVSDLVAGEKERGTMETLMISPVSRVQIALGKIFALTTVCFVSSMTSLLGVGLLAVVPTDYTKNLFPKGLDIAPLTLIAVLIALVSLCAMFASLMVSISAYARNIRESQTYLSVLSFAILMPALFSQFIGFTNVERATWVAFTPVLNTAMALRGALQGDAPPLVLIGSMVTNITLAVLLLIVATRLFKKEEILLRV